METLTTIIGAINGVVWGPMMLVLVLGVGLFLQLGLRLMPILKLGTGFKLLWSGRSARAGDEKEGEISPFNALMAIPKLIALALLSPVVFTLTREYFARQAGPEATVK